MKADQGCYERHEVSLVFEAVVSFYLLSHGFTVFLLLQASNAASQDDVVHRQLDPATQLEDCEFRAIARLLIRVCSLINAVKVFKVALDVTV